MAARTTDVLIISRMPKRKLVCVIVIAFFIPVLSHAESCCVQQLNKANQQLTEAYLNHDMAGLLRLYARNSVSMPEYHVTLFGKEAIAEYEQRWMDSAQVTSYSRSTKIHRLMQGMCADLRLECPASALFCAQSRLVLWVNI